jgi:hypothetical protein
MRPSMGEVVRLSLQKRRHGDSAARTDDSTAQILLFTGVRYQRMPDTPALGAGDNGAPTQNGVGGKRKRKRG